MRRTERPGVGRPKGRETAERRGSVPRATSDRGAAGTEETRGYCRSAGERPDFFSFLAISSTHSPSDLPSSFLAGD